jgi:diadenosine tetraphosphate (Ap4A) HIT family hydrolase
MEIIMTSTNDLNQFKAKFQVDELKVLETEFWTWSIRPGQVTLGSSVISLNRYALHLSDVTSEEMADLSKLIKILENSLKTTFDHNIMNYLMLMMVDHHVHYHVIPRYEGIRQFAGLEWVDNGWPALPVMGDAQHVDDNELTFSIRDALNKSI